MIGSLMMCLSVVVLLVGMLAGIAMGIEQNFTPAHAHLNLIGGVLSSAAADAVLAVAVLPSGAVPARASTPMPIKPLSKAAAGRGFCKLQAAALAVTF
jgi:zona occludens toxin (predicted ATPase)